MKRGSPKEERDEALTRIAAMVEKLHEDIVYTIVDLDLDGDQPPFNAIIQDGQCVEFMRDGQTVECAWTTTRRGSVPKRECLTCGEPNPDAVRPVPDDLVDLHDFLERLKRMILAEMHRHPGISERYTKLRSAVPAFRSVTTRRDSARDAAARRWGMTHDDDGRAGA